MSKFIGPTFQDNDIQLLESGDLADGTIKCRSRTWKVHRMLLASRLKFFKAAFYGHFSEGSSGEVDFPEADPDSVDIMLRHLYRKEPDVKILNTPISCVRCWKLADYLQFESLKSLAVFILHQHLDAMALLACSNMVADVDQLPYLKYFFDAFREVCGDEAMKPLRDMFVVFLWVTRYDLLVLPETSQILKERPELNEKLLKLILWGKVDKERPTWIPQTIHIESQIQSRTDVIFPEEINCPQCSEIIDTLENTVAYNPFPVGNWRIGEIIWCDKCVHEFNGHCGWPWREFEATNHDKIEVQAWSWSDEE